MNFFPILTDFPFLSAFYIGRVPGMQLPADRQEALRAQLPFFKKTVHEFLPTATKFLCAQEVHGSEIAIISGSEGDQNLTRIFHGESAAACESLMQTALDSGLGLGSMSNTVQRRNPRPPCLHHTALRLATNHREICGLIPEVDGLMTRESNVALGITFADCAPVWIVNPARKAVALVHSGKRGTEAGIVPKAIQWLQTKFESQPQDLIITIGPCIRPPCYEVDFAKSIREQALEAGVGEIRDEKICTACDLEKYYSYRREKGKTGHMLAVVMIRCKRSTEWF